MRILFLSNMYPPYLIGGYEQLCEEVAIRLQERSHEIKVLTSCYGVGRTVNNGSLDTIIRSLYLQADPNYYHADDFFLNHSAHERFNLAELRKTIEVFHPDVIMVWGMWNLSHKLPYWAEQWMPGRVAYYIASYWPIDLDPHSMYWRLKGNHKVTELLKKPLRAFALSQLSKENYPPQLEFNYAVCCSQYVRDTLIRAGKLTDRAHVIYHGIDPKPYSCEIKEINEDRTRPLRLIYFGRLIHDKGVHTAVEAVSLLKQRELGERIKLTILGSGHPDYEAHLRSLVDQMRIADQVHFIGRVPRGQIPSKLCDYDISLFTSVWPEPMARSVMEAMMSGLLIIGTTVGGQAEMLVNDKNALDFPTGGRRHAGQPNCPSDR